MFTEKNKFKQILGEWKILGIVLGRRERIGCRVSEGRGYFRSRISVLKIAFFPATPRRFVEQNRGGDRAVGKQEQI